MDLDHEDLRPTYRRERIGSHPELPNIDHSAAINLSPVSSRVAGPQSPDSANSMREQSQSDAEETRAPVESSTSSRNLHVRKQSDLDPTPHGKGQQQAYNKKPATKSISRYDSDSWGNWDANAPSQPVHHRGYQQAYPQPASANHNPFAPSGVTPYTSDGHYLSPNHDYRPYAADRLNLLVRNPPNYAQPWTQPLSTVSIPYSLLQPRLDTGAKDFSSYSFAPPPLPSGSEDPQGHSNTGSSHSLPARLDSKGSDDSDDDHRGVILPSNGLHAGSSSQSRKSRARPTSRPTELLVTKGSLDHQVKPVPAVLSTLSGAEAVPLPPSRFRSPSRLGSKL